MAAPWANRRKRPSRGCVPTWCRLTTTVQKSSRKSVPSLKAFIYGRAASSQHFHETSANTRETWKTKVISMSTSSLQSVVLGIRLTRGVVLSSVCVQRPFKALPVI